MSLLHRPAPTPVWVPVGGRESPRAMRDLRVLTWLPVGSLLSLVALSLSAPSVAERLALPIALTGAVLGVPHGAVDHLVPWWWGPTAGPARRRIRSMVLFVFAYAAAAALALAAFLVAPTPSLVVFLVLSAVHFGRGEVVAAAERRGRSAPGPGSEWPATAAFGAAVVGLLLWAHPESVLPYIRPVSPWLADATMNSRLVGLVCVAGLVVLGLGALLRARYWREAAELALVVMAFSVSPPLAAFGMYFGLWHAVRHTGRLLDLAHGLSNTRTSAAGSTPPAASWGSAARDVAIAAAVPTLVALVAMAALWTGRDLASLQSEVAVLLALTFPHAAVVWALDRRVPRMI